MEEDTPKFCDTKETDINLQSAFSFSIVYEKKNTKPHYHSQHNSSHKSKKQKKQNPKLNRNSKKWKCPVKIESYANLISII